MKLNFSKYILTAFLVLITASCTDVSRPSNKFIYTSQRADSIIVKKEDRKLYLLKNGRKFKEYDIQIGQNPIGPKQFEGDKRTPEGKYIINHKNPNSQYYLSLQVSYPTKEQREFAKQFGKSAGGNIMIHGLPNKDSWNERKKKVNDDSWTEGCIAVTDVEMREIYALVDVGTPIYIRP
jgi:murein L,D-transpeptidase YafK